MAFIAVLVLLSAVFGFLFWRKRKYGLSSLFGSTSGARPEGGRRLLDDDGMSTNYTHM